MLRRLRPVDALIIAFAILCAIFCLLFSKIILEWRIITVVNISISAGILLLAGQRARSQSKALRIVHEWYPAPVIFFSFKEMYIIMQAMNRQDYDNLLIAIDRWIFHTDPTVWLAHVATPVLTEALQISYASFYFLMLAVGYGVYRRNDEDGFSFVMFTFLLGFFLSYVGYLLLPAVGPRFTLHNFDSMNTELPGLYVTTFIRDLINAGESIPKNVVDPIVYAQRDAFPSGHTEMTLIVIYLARKFRLKSRYILYLFGTLLIISTVYLRYHYVIDLVGGVLFMVLTVSMVPELFSWWQRFAREEEPVIAKKS